MEKISTYLEELRLYGVKFSTNILETNDVDINCVSYDSTKVQKDSIFICKGANFKKQYLFDAIENGAIFYLSETKYDCNIDYIITDDIRKATAIFAKIFYKNACLKLKIIGITGTKGKTTTAFMLKSILGDKAGILSSLICFDGKTTTDSSLTTPEPLELHEYFYKMLENGMEYVIMEVSSQALKYNRVFGITFFIAAFLNIGIDHISPTEHTDFEDYYNSKKKIFKQSLVNIAYDPLDETEASITFGGNGNYQILDLKTVGQGISFNINKFKNEIYLDMYGKFNALNALCAIAIADFLGIAEQNIIAALAIVRIAGRMEVFKGKKADIIVDYAHNHLSFKTVLEELALQYKNIITVFGCPGDKAKSRRIDLPGVAGILSNTIIITEDDPAHERFKDICDEMLENITKDCIIIEDRETAIRQGYKLAKKGDVLFVAGKGSETFMKRGNTKQPYISDVCVAKNIIKEEI